jgi:TolB-like protein/DNA-binding winged helix-turn-helix (wHTH) protein/Tfp pilus assembly protein PilF
MIFRFEACEIDAARYELRRAGAPIPLEPKVLDVILHLVRGRDRLVTKDELLREVWQGVHVTESALTRAVSLARAALGDSAAESRVIETVPGRGYRWKAPVEVVEAAAPARSAVAAAHAPSEPPAAPPAWPPADPAQRRSTKPARIALAILGAGVAIALAVAIAWPHPLGWLLAATGRGLPPGSPALPAEPSVVVLPFRDLSPDAGYAYLAEAITEDLTSALVRIPAVFVISRSSADTYVDRDATLATIGRELGVRYAVEGSVRADPDRLVVTSRLVDVDRGVHVWGDRFETPLGDALSVQVRLAEDIVAALGTRIAEAELDRLRDRETVDFDAYELFVQARADFYTYTRSAHARARARIERALALDPEYAHAATYRAGLELAPYYLGWDVDPARIRRARDLAARAIELDPFAPLPHTVIAMSYMAEGRTEEAVEEARRAVALGPNSDVCQGVEALALARSRRPVDALRALDRALRLNPRHPELYWLMAGLLQAQAGRRDVGIRLMERVREANPEIVPPRLALISLYAAEGNLPRTAELGREILAVNPVLDAETALRIFPLARQGSGDEARVLAAFRAAGLR